MRMTLECTAMALWLPLSQWFTTDSWCLQGGAIGPKTGVVEKSHPCPVAHCPCVPLYTLDLNSGHMSHTLSFHLSRGCLPHLGTFYLGSPKKYFFQFVLQPHIVCLLFSTLV